MLTKITWNEGMNKSMVLFEYMPVHYRDFFYNALEPALKRGGLFIMAMKLKLLVCHTKIV